MDAFKEKDDFFVGNTGLNIHQFEASWIAKENAPAVFISATGALNVVKLRETIVSEIVKASPKQYRF
jgi:GTP-binding protein HflX